MHLRLQKLLEEADELADAGECEEALKTYKLALRIAAAKAEDTPEGSLGVALYLEKLAACHMRMKDGDKAIALLHRQGRGLQGRALAKVWMGSASHA